MRDCKNCLHMVPILKDDGTWTADCEMFDCEFISRKDAIKALEEKLQSGCENCDYRKFSETFVDGVVEVMNKNGITSVEQLSEILKGGKR